MNESNIMGISVRALIAYTLVIAVCAMEVIGHKVDEPLYTLVVMAVSFYLGKSSTGGQSDVQSNITVLQQPVQKSSATSV